MTAHAKDIIDGSVTVEDLTLIVRRPAYAKQFMELYLWQLDVVVEKPPLVEESLKATIQDQRQNAREGMTSLLESRRQEMDRLEMEKELNENLRRVCDDLGTGKRCMYRLSLVLDVRLRNYVLGEVWTSG